MRSAEKGYRRYMLVALVTYPGTWLDLPDKELAFELEGMLRYLEDRVTEAAVALMMFEHSLAVHVDERAEWERDAQLRREIDAELRAEFGDLYFQDFERYRIESEHRTLRRKAELGILPSAYRHKVPFIHAHSFAYAVDSFGKFLDELCLYEARCGRFGTQRCM